MNLSGPNSRWRPFPGLRRLFHLGHYHPDPDRALDEELGFHFQETVEELQGQGMGLEQARAEAERRFGDVSGYRSRLERIDREQVRMERWEEFFFILRQNLIHALHSLRRSPGFTAAVITILALGIWANTVMFSILDRILLRPPAHVENHEQVRKIFRTRTGPTGLGDTSISLSYPDYEAMKTTSSFSAVAAYSSVADVTVGRGENSRRARMTSVTPEFLPLLGVQPALGRSFSSGDDEIGAPLTAMIGYGFWQQHFGGDPDVMGHTLELGFGGYFGGSSTVMVIGVMPRGFTGVGLEKIDLWLPLIATHAARTGNRSWLSNASWSFLRIVTRLESGIDDETAGDEATHLHLQTHRKQIYEGDYDERARILLGSLIAARGPDATRESAVARWLGGVSLIVLLIACTNVVNLTLGRTVDRSREMAIRLALGVSRSRLIGQLITESLVLALLGGGIALLLTRGSADFLQGILFPELFWPHSPVSGRIIGFTLIVSAISGLVSGIVPAVRASRPSLGTSIRSGDRGSSGRRSKTGLTLQIAQGALSVILLIGAGLFVRSMSRVHTLDLGLDVDHLAEVMLEMDETDPAAATVRARLRRSADRVSRLPGVEGVAITTSPLGWGLGIDISVPGLDSIPELPTGSPMVHYVSHGYCNVLGLRLLSGRGITASDGPSGARSLLVNETMARTIWPGQNAVGQHVVVNSQIDDPDSASLFTVVGVVENASNGELILDPSMQFYMPLDEAPDFYTARALYVRTRDDPELILGQIQREALAGDPDLRYARVQIVGEIFDSEARSWSLGATMFSLFGLLALVVAATGLYSILSYHVACRTREIGIRTALGARPGSLVNLVLTEGLRLTVVGLGLGFGIALAAAPYVEPLLFEISAADPVVYGTIAAVLLLTSLAAGIIPAWRVNRLNPVTALQIE